MTITKKVRSVDFSPLSFWLRTEVRTTNESGDRTQERSHIKY
ncbi:hypothetical protein [Microcoleus sp. CAWBG58]|nr:hypothetical protein [Microcoleus sp. CAWBG58]